MQVDICVGLWYNILSNYGERFGAMASDAKELYQKIEAEVSKIVVGKADKLRLVAAALFADGHILLDDLPGVGKTTLAKTLSRALGCEAKRVQFTPDLLPSDVTGMNVYDRASGAFRRLQGPVMTNLLLADELNRAIPRTQSALLEAMEERQVTLDGETEPLPKPFFVLATQNPVESESTFRLPAAQLDRFMMCLTRGYPAPEEERTMLRQVGSRVDLMQVQAVTSPEEICAVQKDIEQGVSVSDEMLAYIVSLTTATRSCDELRLGASPRASRALFRAAKALAAIGGRDYITPDDVKTLAVPVLAHRVVLSSRAVQTGRTAAAVVTELCEALAVPPKTAEVFHA